MKIRRANFGVSISPLSVTKLVMGEVISGGLGRPMSLDFEKGVLTVVFLKSDGSEVTYIIPAGNIACLEVLQESK